MKTNKSLNMQSGKALWFMVCLIILGFGVGSFVLLQALKPEPEKREQVELIPTVETLPLSYRLTPLIVEGNGIVSPTAEIGLSSQVTGEIISTHPSLVTGGTFKKGEVMMQIDSRSFEANLAEAEANKVVILSTLKFVNKQIERLEPLREQGYTPEESLDDAISRRDQALANIARQDAIIENRRLELERTSITAPFDGKVLSESVDIGDIVSPGRELARFYASAEVEIVVSLNTQDTAFIPGLWDQSGTNNNKALVTVNHGDHQYQWEGYLDRVEADIDQTTRTIDVVIRVPEPFQAGNPVNSSSTSFTAEAPPLLVGMYSTVSIEGISLDKHFVLPTSAVRADNTIWAVDTEGSVHVVPVEFVKEEGSQSVLLAPQLSAGSNIIISDIALFSDGMRVRSLSEGAD